MTAVGCTFVAAALVSLVVTPIVARIARARRIVDQPGARKVHKAAVPRVGGLAVALGVLIPAALVVAIHGPLDDAFHNVQTRLLALLGAAASMLLVGLVDDVRGLRARLKFLAQLVAAAAVCAFGVRITALSLGTLFSLHLGWLSWPVTIFWIVGITNAVNLIDGLDGLCAGICAATCAVVGVFALHTGQPIMAILMAALLGSLVGFLYFNFNPARVFMGDSGTYFLGFTLAASSVLCATKASTLVGLALPALALGVPIFDTLFSILHRFLERRSIFAPDRSHIHHRLVDMGLRQRHVVLFLYIVTVMAAAMGLFMMVTRNENTLIVFGCVVVLLVLVFRVAGSVSFRNTIAALRHKLAIARMTQEHRRRFEDAELLLREATTFQAWWQAVCAAARQLEFVSLRFVVTDRDGTARSLDWQSPEAYSGGLLKISVPIRDRRAGPPLQAEAKAPVNGSVELAGRRVAYFGRLLDEHSLATLPRQPSRPKPQATATTP